MHERCVLADGLRSSAPEARHKVASGVAKRNHWKGQTNQLSSGGAAENSEVSRPSRALIQFTQLIESSPLSSSQNRLLEADSGGEAVARSFLEEQEVKNLLRKEPKRKTITQSRTVISRYLRQP